MRIIVLDGGLGTELEARGVDTNTKLWSAAALVNNPQAIYDIHMDYLKAGAEIITSATYQASVEGFEEAGYAKTELEAEKLIKRAIKIAKSARDDYAGEKNGRFTKVAASIGPYGAVLADGAEYNGQYPSHISRSFLYDFHLRRLSIIMEESPDLLAFETLPNFLEIMTLIDIATTPDLVDIPFWFSFSIKDSEHLADGTPLKDVVDYVMNMVASRTCSNCVAIGANCFPITMALDVLAHLSTIKSVTVPLIIYPNSGELYDPETKVWRATTPPSQDRKGSVATSVVERVHNPSMQTLASETCRWFNNGARVVGGCCRTGPKDIRDLASVSRTF